MGIIAAKEVKRTMDIISNVLLPFPTSSIKDAVVSSDLVENLILQGRVRGFPFDAII